MRKGYLALAAAAIIGLGIVSDSFAALTPSAYLNINVTVTEAVGSSIVRDTVSDNQSVNLELNQTSYVSATTCVFRNNGSNTDTWSVQADASGLGGVWTLKEDMTALAPNELRAYGIFFYDAAINPPTAAQFSGNDIIRSTTRVNCSDTVYADGTVVPQDQKGINVPPQSLGWNLRNMWYMFDAPITTSNITATRSFAVVVYAQSI